MVRLSESVVLRQLANPCWRKRKHVSHGIAQAALRSLRRTEDAREVDTLNVYQCRFCGSWHVGHTRSRQDDNNTLGSASCTENAR